MIQQRILAASQVLAQTWCAAIRDHVTQVAAARAAADQTRPRRDGTVRPVPITRAWLLRQDQGPQVLGKTLHGTKNDSGKGGILQTLGGAFPGSALLCRWKLRATATWQLCACPAETQAHIQCVCPALKGVRIAAHHTLAGRIFDTVRDAGAGWTVHRELTVVGLLGIPHAPCGVAGWRAPLRQRGGGGP